MVFELNVRKSLYLFGPVVIKLCKKPEHYFLFVHGITFRPDLKHVKERIDLTPEQAQEIIEKYKNAMQYNTLDDARFLDGSEWCIKSRKGFTYSNACFFTPSSKPEKRGLSGLHKLGLHLWEVTGLKKDGVELY